MDKIERVARAICVADGNNPDEATSGSRILFCELFKREAQAAIDAVQQWLPIETAPHGTDVILYCPYRNETNQERMEFGKATRGVHGLGKSTVSAHPWATHWMPLPEPPK